MTITRTAGHLYRTELTPRDFLLGALLAFEDAPAYLDRHTDNARIGSLNALVRELCIIVDACQANDYLTYGLPAWLVGSIAPPSGAGMGRFLHSLVEQHDGWDALAQAVDADLNFDELCSLHERLMKPCRTPFLELRSLRDDTVLSMEGQLIERTIAASGFGPSAKQIEEIVRVAGSSPDYLLRELGSRLGRMDIATRHREDDRCGVIIGADIRINRSGERVEVTTPDFTNIRKWLSAQKWAPTDHTFVEGLDRGRKAAIDLLRTVGIQNERLQEIGQIDVRIRGILPHTVLSDRSAGLPLALAIISKISNLGLPRIVATGAFTEHGAIEPMSPLDARNKLNAVKTDGMNEALLVYSPQAAGEPELILLHEATLLAACRAMWGTAWDEWSSAVSDKAIDRSGMAVGWRDGRRPGALLVDGEPIIVETPQAASIVHRFEQSSTPMLQFLHGPIQSGKTWIAQEVEETLAGGGRWDVLVLRPVGETFPVSDDLRPLIEMLIQQRRMRHPLLLILDDLEWREGAEDAEQDLSMLKEELKISILAVARWDDLADWDTITAVNELAVVGEARLRDFGTKLAASNPYFGEAARNMGTAIRGAGGNLWWVVRLALIGASHGAPASYRQLLTEYYDANYADLSEMARTDLLRVAALSYAGLSTPQWFLETVDENLRRVGGRRDSRGNWWLASRATCESVLVLVSGADFNPDPRAVREHVETLVAHYVNIAINKDRPSELVGAFERLRADYDILAGVLRQCEVQLEGWAPTIESPALLARLFDAIEENLSAPRRQKIALALVQLVIARAGSLNAGDLAKCLNVLRQQRHILEKTKPDEEDLWTQLVAALKKHLPRILRNPAKPYARKLLVRALWRMHDQKVLAILTENGDQLLQHGGPVGPADYRLALEFLDVIRKGSWSSHSPPELPRLKALAEQSASSEDGIRSYVSRLILRLELGLQRSDWDVIIPQLQREIRSGLAQSSALEAALTFGLMTDFNRALTVRFFTGSNLAVPIAGLLKVSSAGEAAELLRTLSRIHGMTARDVLYEQGGPRLALANVLAKRIQDDGDAKGAGRLLSAALPVDVTFGTIEGGFARRLANLLGQAFFEAQFIVDPRTSVLFHLLEGMVGADISLSPTIRTAAVEGVVRSIDLAYREWAPRLALLLVSHAEFGDWFKSELAHRLTDERLLNTMTKARTTEALAAFHELGVLLFPDLPARFADAQHEKTFAVLHRADRPETLTRAASAMSRTLRRAGDPFSGRTIIRRLDEDWPRRLMKATSPGDLAEAIRGLTALDVETAHAAVSASAETLSSRINRAFLQQPQTGVDLLRAVEGAVPGFGRTLVEQMQKRRGMWDTIMEQIAFDQDPRSQGMTFFLLSTLGGLPSERIRKRVFDQWLTRLVAITTPIGILELLRMFAAWEIDWAREAASQVSAHRLGSRLRAGVPQDLERAHLLVSALMATGAESAAKRIIEAIASVPNVPRRIGMKNTARLVSGLRVPAPELGRKLSLEASDLVTAAVATHYVLDDVALWLEIGWTALNARLIGDEIAVEKMPWHFALQHPPQVTLWGAGWLASRPWNSDAVEKALQEVQREALKHRAWAAAAILTIASERSRETALLTNYPEMGLDAFNSSPYHLEVLLEVARKRHSALTDFVGANLDAIRQRIETSSLFILHPTLPSITLSLSRIERMMSAQRELRNGRS